MLKLKILVIFVVTLISIYYIIGFPRSRSELQRNLRNNIRLGADLRGGSQLTLQIHLQDAFNAEAQETAARLRASGLGGTVAVEEAASVWKQIAWQFALLAVRRRLLETSRVGQ